MIQERRRDRAATEFFEVLQFGVRLGHAHLFADVQARERADAIHAVGETERNVIRRFEIRIRLHRFADELVDIFAGRAGRR